MLRMNQCSLAPRPGRPFPGGYRSRATYIVCNAGWLPRKDHQAHHAHQCSLSCTIRLVPTKTQDQSETTTNEAITCQEYRHESTLDPINHVFKEVVTIESTNSGQFQIDLDINPTVCCVLENTAANQSGRTTAQKSLISLDYAVKISLDGIEIGTAKMPRTQDGQATYAQVLSTDHTAFRLFQFSPIKLVDPDDDSETTKEICQDEQVIKSLGTIQLEIFKCQLRAHKNHIPYGSTDGTKTTNEMSFSESNKKARLSSTAGLGDPIIREAKPYTKYTITQQAAHPFLHFIFQYKPQSILVAEGIIPNPVIPAQPPVIDSSATSTSKPKLPPYSIMIDSDSEPENNNNDKQKKVKKENRVKKEDSNNNGSGCQCNCKNKRPAEDGGQVAESSNEKRARISDADQKPNVNQRVQPSKPIFIDLTL
ncbi:hypothetical protein PtA15_2A865 [Puccinia triticina]|uniref:DUF7918 domain-containing protein n=1 Tax=Puccinia triticina TaxID=208348 RepID=A0ABY7CCA7_9BASI|nr:uncharacterized protein PtA15_2A865 [Puccinia triticina]WAQ82548.1 hypothetical protein PtA15_2A865 [Puccinia triticina]